MFRRTDCAFFKSQIDLILSQKGRRWLFYCGGSRPEVLLLSLRARAASTADICRRPPAKLTLETVWLQPRTCPFTPRTSSRPWWTLCLIYLRGPGCILSVGLRAETWRLGASRTCLTSVGESAASSRSPSARRELAAAAAPLRSCLLKTRNPSIKVSAAYFAGDTTDGNEPSEGGRKHFMKHGASRRAEAATFTYILCCCRSLRNLVLC